MQESTKHDKTMTTMLTERQKEIISLIKKEVKPALGCTEPIAVALAVAKAMEIIQEKDDSCDERWRMVCDFDIRVEVSGNILKNGMGVGIPGTGMIGLDIAAALGAVGALVSMVGDLAASAIKRDHDIKDYGKLIPGHGGIMDRFDSVIIASPLIFWGLALISRLSGVGL